MKQSILFFTYNKCRIPKACKLFYAKWFSVSFFFQIIALFELTDKMSGNYTIQYNTEQSTVAKNGRKKERE